MSNPWAAGGGQERETIRLQAAIWWVAVVLLASGCGGEAAGDDGPMAGSVAPPGSGDGDAASNDVDGDAPATGDGDGSGAVANGDGDGDGAIAAGDGDGDGDGDGAIANGDGDEGAADEPPRAYSYNACDSAEDRVGNFSVGLEELGAPLEPYSAVAGLVNDSVTWKSLPDPVMSAGDCTLVRGRQPFCDPECSFDEVCDENGQCVPQPVGQDVGTITVTGLKDGPLSIEPRAPKNNYGNRGTLTHPAFDEGTAITLEATGGATDPFTLVGEGVAALALNEAEVALEDGQPATVSWNAPAQPGRARVLAELNISLHGGDPLRIQCDTEDDGSLEIPAELVSALLAINYSGFPAIRVRRQTADSVQLPWGCAELRVYSTIERHPVSIPGLSSCNETQPTCPDGLNCNTMLMRCE